ncbi:hypothetical protein H8B13_03240 [Hymenobacter sp. BT188]|uniref:hypothetical protein n=1 Tax=Hymenobacter sp. BT188 TaxID=2763504 RepID=UPI0016519182|nr:hypothetical protein [Hymenobacter sp. BT188]MBC6605823.1 hypothetical protein [Hymenobacter sp. BT188]
MDITSLPTDSFYKFLAIAGLIIMFGGPIYIEDQIYEVEKTLIELEGDSKILEVKDRRIKQRMIKDSTEFSEGVKAMEELSKDLPLSQIAMSEHKRDTIIARIQSNLRIADSILQYQRMLDEKRYDEMMVSSIEVVKYSTKVDLMALNAEKVFTYRIFEGLLVSIGFVLTLFGFKKWYEIQQYLDRIVIEQVIKRE